MTFWPEAANATFRLAIGGATKRGDDDRTTAAASSLAVSVDADAAAQNLVARIKVGDGGGEGFEATYDMASLGKPEGGLVVAAWNMLRVLIEPRSGGSAGGARVRIWFNPQFPDVTGASVAPPHSQLVAMPPRLDLSSLSGEAASATPMVMSAVVGAAVRVDYASVLPPKLYGIADLAREE